MATGVSIAGQLTGASHIDTLLYGTLWSGTALTYSFPTLASDLQGYSAENTVDPAYFRALSAVEMTVFEQILFSWSRVSGLTFTEAAAGSGDISIYWYEDPFNGTARVVDFPSAQPEGGDIQLGYFVRPDVSGNWDPGSYSYFTIIHELGHALGLKHPHDSLNGFPARDADQDSVLTSVMSYRSYPGHTLGAYTVAAGSFPSGPMLDDIAAIQHLYGANWYTNSGDTTYSFDPGAEVVLQTIWDGGGNDTYNFSSYTTNLTINLQPGEWSDLGGQYAILDSTSVDGAMVPLVTAPANLANSYLYQGDLRSLIENARGGSGNDRIVGNQGENVLSGGAGSDTLAGGSGRDTLTGGSGSDILTGGSDDDTFSGTASELNGDEITDFGLGDRIVVYSVDLSSLYGQAADSLLDFGGGNFLTLASSFVSTVWNTVYDGVKTTLKLNTVPVAADDHVTADANGWASGNVILGVGGSGRDTDADNDVLIAALETGPRYGTLTLNADGSYSYTADAAVLRALGQGDLLTDTFTYTVSDQEGGAATATVSITLMGANDAPVFAGTVTGSVTEDSVPVASGILNVTDMDTGEAGFLSQAPVRGAYGTFSFNHLTGEWSYLLDNASPAVQALGEGETKTETFTVVSIDGTERTVTVTVTGARDAEVVDGVVVDRQVTDNGDGTSSQVVIIPAVTDGRDETSGERGYADIPLVTSGSRHVLTVQLATGIGLTAMGPAAPKAAGSSLADLMGAIQAHAVQGSSEQTQMSGGGSGFIQSLPSGMPLVVQSIMLTQSGDVSGIPLVISGSSDPDAPATALVIDARGLAAGTIIRLENVAFATVFGNVQVTGGTGSQVVYGDSASQHIVLGAGHDTLHGGAGDDHIGSRGGSDRLYGDEGRDVVSGGLGHDHLFGGTGKDRLYGGHGSDRLDGGAGNDIASAGKGNDALYGRGGNDRLYGGRGNDTIIGDAGRDIADGGAGDDRLYGGPGRDVLRGGDGHDIIRGGSGGDIIDGGSGNDVLSGGLGPDTLSGGDGQDVFMFDTAPGKNNVDTILSFSVQDDTIRLQGAIFTAAGERGWLSADAFRIGAEAVETKDRIVYNPENGMLYYDSDGSGSESPLAFAKLSLHLMLTEKNFFIV